MGSPRTRARRAARARRGPGGVGRGRQGRGILYWFNGPRTRARIARGGEGRPLRWKPCAWDVGPRARAQKSTRAADAGHAVPISSGRREARPSATPSPGAPSRRSRLWICGRFAALRASGWARARRGLGGEGAAGAVHAPRVLLPANPRPRREIWGNGAAAVSAMRLGCGPARQRAEIDAAAVTLSLGRREARPSATPSPRAHSRRSRPPFLGGFAALCARAGDARDGGLGEGSGAEGAVHTPRVLQPATRGVICCGGRRALGLGPPRTSAEINLCCRRWARSSNQLGPEGGKALGDALAKGAFPALQTVDLRWVCCAACSQGWRACGWDQRWGL